MRFNDAVDERRIRIPNRTDIFGDQILMNGEDEEIGIEKDLLSNATLISYDEAKDFVTRYGGICYPAHIDRDANGVIATLGCFPDDPPYAIAELHDGNRKEEFRERYPNLKGAELLVSSDAHYLWDIRDAEHFLELEDEPYSGAFVRKQLFRHLKGENT